MRRRIDTPGAPSSTIEPTLTARIIGAAVPMLVPRTGPVHVLIIGEAPGPRGADKSAVPFWGDAAGRHLYEALAGVGAVTLPTHYDRVAWDGAVFRKNALMPVAHGVALSNAYDHCPTDDGFRFRAPTRSELFGPPNRARFAAELDRLGERGLKGILTLGRVATNTVATMLESRQGHTLHTASVVHPSAQGLLSMAPNRGKGAKMADLQAQWMTQCQAALAQLGFSADHGGASHA
ncbi:MAG: hypothetical protein IBJ03_04065 [Gemmatimonadaceae bacterium]|nr:hypothetical protein [Gemmatimonadaceae bacterium]